MVKIRLLDEEWAGDMDDFLIAGYENVTDLDEDVRNEKGCRKLGCTIDRIEAQAAGTPTADMLVEYKDAIESRSGYLHTAAYLRGIRRGFLLARSHEPDGKDRQAAGRRDL